MLLVATHSVNGQKVVSGGLFPEMALSHSQQNWKYTLKVESQNYQFNNTYEEEWSYKVKQNDLQAFIENKITPRISISAGYQYRISSDRANTHRSIQQISFVQKALRFRIGHRFRTDQTWTNESVLHRYRYRLSLEIPINGFSLDPKEFYLLVQDEPIVSLESGESDVENRIYGAVGYLFANAYKLQTGIDYRTDRYFVDGFRHRIWWKTGLFIKI